MGAGDHYRRIFLASIFGLWASSNENPFSLIDGFLHREQMEAGGSEAASLMEAVDEDESGSTVLI